MNWMHEMTDDVSAWAVDHWNSCTGNCNQGRSCGCVDQRQGKHEVDTKQPMPAEACTEVGCEDQSRSADGMVFPILLVASICCVAISAWAAVVIAEWWRSYV